MRASRGVVGSSVLAFVALGPGCDGDGSGRYGADGADGVPTTFRMIGEAVGTDEAGRTGTCRMDLLFELEESERTPRHVTYTGTHGGELQRAVLEEDGSGLGFLIDVFGEVEVELIFPDTLIIEIPVNDTPESRFYQRLSRLEGVIDRSGEGEGLWTCAPLDIDQGGYVDTMVTVEGDWVLAPEAEIAVDQQPGRR